VATTSMIFSWESTDQNYYEKHTARTIQHWNKALWLGAILIGGRVGSQVGGFRGAEISLVRNSLQRSVCSLVLSQVSALQWHNVKNLPLTKDQSKKDLPYFCRYILWFDQQ